MKITVNDVELEFEGTSDSIIAGINEHLMKQGLLVDKIVVNETEYFNLDGINWEEVSEHPVEIRTITPVLLCINTLKDAHDYLEKLIEAFGKMAELYRGEKPDEGSKLLTSSITGIEWVNEVIVKVEPVLGLDYNNMEVNGENVTDFFMKYSSILNQITESFEKKDYFLTADLVEFELVPCFIGWQTLFTKIVKIFENNS